MTGEIQKGYVYYRCHTDNCPTNSIREEQLEATVERLLRNIKLADQDIEAITNQVEKCLKSNDNTKARTASRLQLDNVQQRLNNLTDALLDELIDKDTFKQRQEKLLLDQTRLRQELVEQPEKALSADMVRQFLERLKNLAEHYVFAPSPDKREIVEITTSNRKVIDKTVYLEPSKWLSDTQNLLGVLHCGGSRPTSRTRRHVSKKSIEDLLKIVDQQSVSKILEISSPVGSVDASANSLL